MSREFRHRPQRGAAMSTRTIETHEAAAPSTPNSRAPASSRPAPVEERPSALKNGGAHAAAERLAAEAPPASTAARPRRSPIPLVIAALVAVALIGFGVRQWLYGRDHVSTDNAQ